MGDELVRVQLQQPVVLVRFGEGELDEMVAFLDLVAAPRRPGAMNGAADPEGVGALDDRLRLLRAGPRPGHGVGEQGVGAVDGDDVVHVGLLEGGDEGGEPLADSPRSS